MKFLSQKQVEPPSDPVLVCQLAQGESAINFWSEGLDLVLDIDYSNRSEREAGTGLHHRLRFKDVAEFHREIFPSPPHEGNNVVQNTNNNLAELMGVIEFKKSSRANAWGKHFSSVGHNYHHYWVAFEEENMYFAVIARSFINEGERVGKADA